MDPSAFTKGQKEAVSALLDTKKSAEKAAADIEKSQTKAAKEAEKAQKAAAKEIEKANKAAAKATEEANKKAKESFDEGTKSAIKWGAALLGTKSLVDFVQGITKSDAALGRLGTSLNTSPELISAWGAAAERMGGTSGATAGSFQTLSDAIQNLHTKGDALPMAFYQIEAQGGRQIELNKGLGQTFVDLAEDLQRIAATDPAKANFLGRQLGIDPDTVNLMIKNGAKVGQIAVGLQRLAPTAAQIKSAQDMQEAWTGLQQEMTSLAREIWTDLSPSLVPLLGAIKDMIVWIHSLVQGHEGWVTAIAAVFAIWTGAKFVRFLGSIMALKEALLGVGAANAAFTGGGLLGFLAANPWVAGLIAAGAVMSPSEANGGEDERARHEKYSGGGGSGNDAIRRRGSGGGKGKDQDETPVGPIDTAPTTNARLAASRKHFFDELNSNPSLRRDVIKTASMENEGSAASMQTVIESMVNRASMNGYHSLNQAVHSGFYGPVNRGGLSGGLSAKNRADGERALAAVAAGGNTIGYRTDQGMLTDPGARRYLREADKSGWAKVHGENFFYMGDAGKRWAREQIEADRRGSSDGGTLRSTIGMLPRVPVYPARGPGSYGAAHAAALNNVSNDNRATTTSNSNETHINGGVHVHTQATDAHGIARDMGGAIDNYSFANSANYGPS